MCHVHFFFEIIKTKNNTIKKNKKIVIERGKIVIERELHRVLVWAHTRDPDPIYTILFYWRKSLPMNVLNECLQSE
jgi:hypothetical protein